MWRMNSGNATIVVEDHAPILLTTWYGTADRALIDGAFDEMERILRQRTKPMRLSISHVVELPSMPRASERKHMAERSDKMTALMHDQQVSIVVMSNPLARAGLTAVQWLSRSAQHTKTAKTIEDGFVMARGELAAMGVPWPESLDPARYRVPRRAAS